MGHTHTHVSHLGWKCRLGSAVFVQSYGTCSSAFRGFVCRVSTPEPSIMSYLTQLKLRSKCVARLLRSSVCVHCTDSTECFEPFAESDFYHLFFLNQCQKAFDIIHLRRDEWAQRVLYIIIDGDKSCYLVLSRSLNPPHFHCLLT